MIMNQWIASNSLWLYMAKCNFGTLREELIQDRLVGLCDSTLSEKLQLDAELTLEKATTAAREKEAVKKQQAMMRKDFQEESHVDTVSNRSKSKPRGQPRQNRVILCRRCGRDYQGQQPYTQPATTAIVKAITGLYASQRCQK